MNASTEAKLSRLARHATRYEVVLSRGAEQFLVCYTARRSFRGLLDAARSAARGLAEIITGQIITDAVPDLYVSREGQSLAFAYDWVVRFSGRTQREAIIAGELPFLGKEPVR